MLTLSNLSLSIHGTPILKNVSFDIPKGEIFGLVGESGSGKSLTSLAIMQLCPRGSTLTGGITFADQSLLDASEKDMCALRGNDISMIFQEPMTALNPVKTIGDQVAETLLIHGAATRKEAYGIAREKLTRVGLPEDEFPLTRYPHELSGGQRQRVSIALAIALRPKLLIADEPTTALDVTTQAQILDLLKDLVREENMSLLLITHDLAVVAGMADHIGVMKSGEIVETGPTKQLFTAMTHPYTKALLEASGHVPKRKIIPHDTPLLTVENAVRDYNLPRTALFGPPPKFRAVDQVSFTLNRGECLGLVGESGCGKSTLTRAILGLETLQGGAITLDGTKVEAGRHMEADLRRKMQVVFQDPYGSFNPRHKVSKLVAEPLFLRDTPLVDPSAHIKEVLKAVHMPIECMDRYIHEFSGGQRQRIAIARALILSPKLIILDEAVSALDVSVRAQILDLLADLQQSLGLSYLFISHDLSVVRAISDRILVMQAGKIVEHGPTDMIFDTPKNPYTKTLMAAAPRIPDDWNAK
ncbi:MAG: ABC transporter ATP-binding protein [Halocynthiibacter sp.]